MPNKMAHDWALAAQEQAEHKVMDLARRVGGAFLHTSVDGHYRVVPGDWWTSAFWPGMLWQVYQRSHAPELAEWALAAEDELERVLQDQRFYGLHHDVGFQFLPTAVTRYRLTGDKSARRRGLLAAALLMSRFNVISGVIEAWNGEEHQGNVIIDSMMNLPLLYWAAEETRLPRYRNLADAHAHTVLRHFVRPDGSVHHIIRFDPTNGARLEDLGGQGHAPGSVWSRGQAWALYGFAVAYRYTHDPTYLATVLLIADAFVAALPADLVPPWDFRAPDAATAPRDSSAGAIAASGLLELARLLPDKEGAAYNEVGIRLLRALSEHCATWDAPQEDALLRHATGNLPAGRDVDVSLIYGDYYFLEALGKLNNNLVATW